MRHHHRHTQSLKALAKHLNDRHGVELTAEELTAALNELNLTVSSRGVPPSGGGRDTHEAGDGLVCIDGPEGCEGELTTLLDSRHVRCERHWSLFLGSEGM